MNKVGVWVPCPECDEEGKVEIPANNNLYRYGKTNVTCKICGTKFQVEIEIPPPRISVEDSDWENTCYYR